VFIVIRKYKVQRGTGPGLAQRVREGFVPLVRQTPGFRGYHLLDGGPDILVSITMFENAEEALASSEAAAEWVRDNVLEFTRGMPEVTVGNALISEPELPQQ
jgi:heme-degrading monooxygenase HmoA